MKFSIIVPVYNVEKYLSQCLDSILSQSFKDFEVIMVDDGSTDSSGKICDEYAKSDSRIKLIHKANGGLVSARKAAAEYISGEYVLNIDSDDYIGERYFEDIACYLDNHYVDMLIWGYCRVSESGRIAESILNEARCGYYDGEALNDIKRTYLFDADKKGVNNGSLIYSIWTKAVKRQIYHDCQLLIPDNISEGEDVSLVWMILQKIESLQICDLDRYYYRTNPNSITGRVSKKTIVQQNNLERFLIENSNNDANKLRQIDGFLIYRKLYIIERAITNGISYNSYTKMIRLGKKYNVFHIDRKINIQFNKLGEMIKVFFMYRNMWTSLYMFIKLRNRRV